MRIQFLLCAAVLGSAAHLPGDEPADAAASPTESAPAADVVARGELLRIDYSEAPGVLPSPSPDATAAETRQGTIYVRIGEDGFARFPMTERILPFANLEVPVLESMLAAHLELHGYRSPKVTVSRRNMPTSLVTVLGLVARPGVYELPADATLGEAIEAAGGVTTDSQPTPLQTTRYVPENAPTTGLAVQAVSLPAARVEHRNLVIRLEHDYIELRRLMQSPFDPIVPLFDERITPHVDALAPGGNADLGYSTRRLCIDGIILHVEKPRKQDPEPEADLFKPL